MLEPVRAEFDLTDAQLGLLAGLAFAVAAIPIGMLVDRVSRKKLLAAALAVWSGLTALCGLATSYLTLLVGRAAVARRSQPARRPECRCWRTISGPASAPGPSVFGI